jgi:hypothetical protein
VVPVAAAVVANGSADCFRDAADALAEILDALALQVGMALKRVIQIGDVSLMMLPVMNLHRLGVDVWFERRVVIRERGKFVRHSSSVGADHRIRPNRTIVLHITECWKRPNLRNRRR